MVGALSIVRFRSAIKEPLDITFLFWSISVGIVLGAGLIPLAVIGSLFIGVIMVLFVNKKTTDTPYVLVLDYDESLNEKVVLDAVQQSVKKYMVKSKTVSPNGVELTIEVRLRDLSTQFVNQMAAIKGVRNAVLVSYNGEYMS